ncbi:RED family protein [Actinidia rufa]|uniref:RED family protein n=1 Tax=Actinidia rufa TaxID=165716 RepID=A0A7J0DPL5_9ERIC|nr:RED family protein [Actinidia rufa]
MYLCREEKAEEPQLPKYRDRAKERREDQNPDYEPTELGSFHAVAPPGTVDLRAADAHKLSIEKSKYLGGDVEHTHLVKGLDYALLHKVRSESDKKPDAGDDVDEKSRSVPISGGFMEKQIGLLVQGAEMEGGFSHDIPTTVQRSKADCPVPEEMVTVSVDGSVLDRIAKIMSYLRLGSSGKVLKKKKKEREVKGKISVLGNEYDEDDSVSKRDDEILKYKIDRENHPPPPPPLKKGNFEFKEKQGPALSRVEEDDIFVGEGIDYAIPSKDTSQSPISEDMEESPRNKERISYFNEPAYGPVPPSEPSHDWQQMNGYDSMQGQAGGYQGEWHDYQYAEQLAYSEQYLQQNIETCDAETGLNIQQDPHLMTQEEKDRGLGSVFKRDDLRLLQLREKDAREKDPNFISESYSECYPGYQEYNREIVDSDDEDDLSKMDMGGRAKGRLHRWDFETEEEWAKYNEQKEAMPKAAFQFGVKMQDGRKTRKQNKDQKLTNELHKINKILSRKKMEKEKGDINDDGGTYDDESHPGKKLRL